MAALPQDDDDPRYTVAEYLALDLKADEKLEYANGEVLAMTGASDAHTLITGNLITLFNTILRDTNCTVRSGDMRVHVAASGSYRYPDLTVTCDDAQFTNDNPSSLLNPTVIVEVLLPSTQATDRGPKLDEYQALPSVQAYLLVSPAHPWIGTFVRAAGGDSWHYHVVMDVQAHVTLPTPACTLPLAEIYRKVVFPRRAGGASEAAE